MPAPGLDGWAGALEPTLEKSQQPPRFAFEFISHPRFHFCREHNL